MLRRVAPSASGLAVVDGIFDRVVDQVGDRLADELPIGGEGEALLGVHIEAQARLFRDRLVELGDVGDDRGGIERFHALGHRAGFEPGDQQQRVEGLDEIVGLLDGLDEAVAVGGRVVRIPERCLGAIAQAVERRLEVVGDVVGDLAQGDHQLLDAAEHGVEALGKAIELVARAVERDALREIARHDGAARFRDRLDASQDAAADGEAGADAEQGEQHDAPQSELAHGAGEAMQVLDVAADDQAPARLEPAARRRRHGVACGRLPRRRARS